MKKTEYNKKIISLLKDLSDKFDDDKAEDTVYVPEDHINKQNEQEKQE